MCITKIKQTGNVPLGRFGHFLTKLYDPSAILLGGLHFHFKKQQDLHPHFNEHGIVMMENSIHLI
jgi:hypothetical protein